MAVAEKSDSEWGAAACQGVPSLKPFNCTCETAVKLGKQRQLVLDE